MSHNYYYLIAGLPVLDFESRMPISVENFLEECRKLLPEADAGLIKGLWQEDISQDAALMTHPVIHAIGEFERAVRNEGVFARAAKWGMDPQKYVRGERIADPATINLVAQSLKETDLIKAERMMDKVRWQMLSDMEVGYYFDLHVLVIYALKLKILERWQKFYSPVGREIWQEMQKIEIPKQLV